MVSKVVAQLEEPRTANAKDAGSSPAYFHQI
jgi:hypothetical protein